MGELCGYLNIYKAPGMTSHDVVFKARKILKTKKIGHTGTLDPNAQGVLVLCVGRATKMVQFLSDLDKCYRAEILFGQATDTCDITGTVVAEGPWDHLTPEAFLDALAAFEGETLQVPPIYSALKVDGKKLYEYAREGKSVEIAPRPISISEITATQQETLPKRAEFRVQCSKGTYIRSLCRDIGERLQIPACMGNLYRERVGSFTIDEALSLEALEQLAAEDRLDAALKPVHWGLEQFKTVTATDRGSRFVRNGNALYPWNVCGDFSGLSEGELVKLYADGEFIGMGKFTAGAGEEDPCVKPVKLLV
ncbi:MAG: tRNA pseudouridine(55) synthase TruB [Eubacterium sp.]|nr:tRNA pseudouridine(55) synthase TruB [Eubacterium sp.]